MLSFCRSGLLALTLVSGSIANVQASIERSTHLLWTSDVSIERLQDKSVLVEYFGETSAKEHDAVVFRVGFIPRFGCAPLLTLHFQESAIDDYASRGDLALFSSNVDNLNVSIDGARLSFPSLIDRTSTQVTLYLNANLQRRITAKVRVQVGNKMRVALAQGKALNFSLQGSREALERANQHCRRHVPGSF